MLVFFDDILIYSKTWEEHLQHVDQALQLLEDHQLYAKPSIGYQNHRLETYEPCLLDAGYLTDFGQRNKIKSSAL